LLKKTAKRLLSIFLVALTFGVLGVSIGSLLFPTGEVLTETSVEVVEIDHLGKGLWSVPKNVIAQQAGVSDPFVLRLKNLRLESLSVEVTGETDGRLLLRSNDLKEGDSLVLKPLAVQAGQAVAPRTGIGDQHLIRLTLEAGMAAARAENLKESLRFVSPEYSDNMGFNFALIRDLLERSYEEFDEPQIELAEPLVIQIKGSKALIQAQIRLSANYQGRRNYLLGDQESPNSILLALDKSSNGWKLLRIEGLRPLGFEERALKLLGSQLGLPLTEAEQKEKQEFCMPCRQRMAERFGG
jgi:hypothetical protein